MVYESDFYTTRRPYTRPSTYSLTTTPRHYVVVDAPDRSRRADEQYSYSYNSNTTSRDGYGAPRTSSYSSTVDRRGGSGPGSSNYNYTTERSSASGDGPGGYRSSYSSTASGRLPGGTSYRHYSYRV